MITTQLAAAILAAIAAGGVAYVFIYPFLSGEARAEKRQKALIGTVPERRGDRVASTVNRREQVALSLKELEAKEKARSKMTLEARIAQAGLSWSKNRYYVNSLIMAFGLALVIFVGTGKPLLALGGLFIGGLGLPRWVLGFLKRRRINKFLDELPNAMDVIVRGIRSGLPLGDCLRLIAVEAKEPVRSEFRVILETHSLGVPLGESIAKLYERMPVPEANFFGIVIGIQQKAGGNLSEALNNLSKVLRDRKKIKGRIRALSAEAKASAGIIASLPFVVAVLTYLSSPSYTELLWTTNIGTIVLAISAFWMIMGVAVMKKMISFEI